VAALGFVVTGVGMILVWSGIKGEDLREVTVDIFTGRRKFAAPAKPSTKAVKKEGKA
jgi:hypothetical protein